MRCLCGTILCALLAAWAAGANAAEKNVPSGGTSPAELARSVTIIRDKYGVPHIDGPTDESVVFGFAYCQAEDYFWQLEDSFLMGLGRYAEVHGPKFLAKDVLNRAFEVVSQAQADFPEMEPEVRSMCEAFAAGVNYYLAKHPETQPRLLTKFEPWQMLACARGVVLEMGFMKLHVARDVVPTMYPEMQAAVGSNAWALASNRTKSGRPLLFVNPHQPYYGFGQFYEAHLRSGEGWNMTGATFFGSPMPTLGHNEHIGWAFTVNEPDLGDAWRVTFDDAANPLNYRYGEGYRTADQWKEKIKVKKGKQVEEVEVTLRKTHLGPIVKQESDTVYLAAQIGKFNEAFLPRQNLKMVRARNLDEFREAMAMLDFHIFNTVYADRENIYYLYNGIVPKRDLSFDWTKPLDGSNPATEWQGIHALDDLPQVLNPYSGFLQNCNSSPFTVTDEGNPAIGDYPAYMCQERHLDNRRAKVSRLLLRDMDDTSFDAWQVAAFDTTVYWALVELPKYAQRLEKLRETDPELAKQIEPYLAHLLDWDCKGTLESTQTTLCLAWYEELYGFGYPAEQLKAEFVNNSAAQLKALVTAADKLKQTHGDWKIAWGDINRLQRHANVADFFAIPFSDRAPSLPSAGLHGPVGVAFNMYFSPSVNLPPLKVLKKHYAVVGASYISTVEFTDRIQAKSLLQYGQSGDPKSPNFFDQAELLSQRKLKDAPFYWEDVEAAAVRKYHPGEEQAIGQQAAGG